MKWAYSIQQKFKAALLLALVCAIIIITNLMGRHQMDELSDSFASVYEDRLVVESYIYMLSEHLYQKKLAFEDCTNLQNNDFYSQLDIHNEAIRGLLIYYENTFLTEEEEAYFQDLKYNMAALQNLERQFIQTPLNEADQVSVRALFNSRFALASANLRQLSNIQLKEGKALNERSQRIVSGSSLITNVEIVILFCIAVILQIIVIASKPVISGNWQKGNLN
ncbi:MAG: hypothetical protein GYB31_12950 [Bacteroidetes bacterium]|nr:hypothetical protein [Bacteroidota bacterium]